MHSRGSRIYLAVLAGVALVAMSSGHALVMLLSPATGYRHVLQGPAVELGLVLLASAAICAAAQVFRALVGPQSASDWVLPAIVKLQALGPVRVIASIVTLQTVLLFAGETVEQKIAGTALAGAAGLFGSTLLVAPLIHFAVGIAAGLALWLLSCAICRHAASAFEILRAVFAWLARSLDVTSAPSRRRLALAALLPPRQPLAYRIANRPPPTSVRFA